MKKTFLLLAFMALVAGSQAQTKEETAVSAAVESLRKLMVDPNKAALEKITFDALSYGHSSGKVQTKAEFIESLLNGSSDFVSIDLTEQTIKVIGDVAIVRHNLSASTNDGGKPGTVKLSILTIWKKQGQWKLLARQAVKVPVPAP